MAMFRSAEKFLARSIHPQPSIPLLLIGQSPWIAMRRLFVVMLPVVVYCTSSIPAVYAEPGTRQVAVENSGEPKPAADGKRQDVARVPLAELPIPVQEMRDAIMAAVLRGDFEELRTAIEWNELRPNFGFETNVDPIEHWQTTSRGGGIEILAILGEILDGPPAKLPIGPDLENNAVYVWPYLSEVPPQHLTPAQQVELHRIAGAEEAAKIIESGKWTWYRLAIGADGTWHTFAQHD